MDLPILCQTGSCQSLSLPLKDAGPALDCASSLIGKMLSTNSGLVTNLPGIIQKVKNSVKWKFLRDNFVGFKRLRAVPCVTRKASQADQQQALSAGYEQVIWFTLYLDFAATQTDPKLIHQGMVYGNERLFVKPNPNLKTSPAGLKSCCDSYESLCMRVPSLTGSSAGSFDSWVGKGLGTELFNELTETPECPECECPPCECPPPTEQQCAEMWPPTAEQCAGLCPDCPDCLPTQQQCAEMWPPTAEQCAGLCPDCPECADPTAEQCAPLCPDCPKPPSAPPWECNFTGQYLDAGCDKLKAGFIAAAKILKHMLDSTPGAYELIRQKVPYKYKYNEAPFCVGDCSEILLRPGNSTAYDNDELMKIAPQGAVSAIILKAVAVRVCYDDESLNNFSSVHNVAIYIYDSSLIKCRQTYVAWSQYFQDSASIYPCEVSTDYGILGTAYDYDWLCRYLADAWLTYDMTLSCAAE